MTQLKEALEENDRLRKALGFIYDMADEEYSYQRSNVGAECALRHIIEKSGEALKGKQT